MTDDKKSAFPEHLRGARGLEEFENIRGGSGSAPPNLVEFRRAANRLGLPTAENEEGEANEGTSDLSPSESYRSDPNYIQYYYKNYKNNPRLPPPVAGFNNNSSNSQGHAAGGDAADADEKTAAAGASGADDASKSTDIFGQLHSALGDPKAPQASAKSASSASEVASNTSKGSTAEPAAASSGPATDIWGATSTATSQSAPADTVKAPKSSLADLIQSDLLDSTQGVEPLTSHMGALSMVDADSSSADPALSKKSEVSGAAAAVNRTVTPGAGSSGHADGYGAANAGAAAAASGPPSEYATVGPRVVQAADGNFYLVDGQSEPQRVHPQMAAITDQAGNFVGVHQYLAQAGTGQPIAMLPTAGPNSRSMGGGGATGSGGFQGGMFAFPGVNQQVGSNAVWAPLNASSGAGDSSSAFGTQRFGHSSSTSASSTAGAGGFGGQYAFQQQQQMMGQMGQPMRSNAAGMASMGLGMSSMGMNMMNPMMPGMGVVPPHQQQQQQQGGMMQMQMQMRGNRRMASGPVGARIGGPQVPGAGGRRGGSGGGNGGGFGSVGGGMSTNAQQQYEDQLASEQLPRSPLLEQFRESRKNPGAESMPSNYTLNSIGGHVIEFSRDQHGSRFIQQQLEMCSDDEKELVFDELKDSAAELMVDVFGNYVIQKLFEHGLTHHRRAMAEQFKGRVLSLTTHMYGCRVIQKALEVIEDDQKAMVVQELASSTLQCVRDQNGNHVIQKCIERCPPQAIRPIADAFLHRVPDMAVHAYGCRVIQRILEHCEESYCRKVLDEIHDALNMLVQDQYGNYVIQHILEHGSHDDKARIIGRVMGNIAQMSTHKAASNVVEKCFEFGNPDQREAFLNEILTPSVNPLNAQMGGRGITPQPVLPPLMMMVKDQYANYVIQKILDVASDDQRLRIIQCIRPHTAALRKYTYGKHIVARIEKMLANGHVTGAVEMGQQHHHHAHHGHPHGIPMHAHPHPMHHRQPGHAQGPPGVPAMPPSVMSHPMQQPRQPRNPMGGGFM